MFPVADSTLCARALAERVLPLYALGEMARCRLHHRGLNDTYKVEDARGDAYFLRVYRAGWRTREEIETELAVLLHLARQEARISTPVSRKDGQTLTPLDCVEGTRWAVLLTAAPGTEVDRPGGYTDELAGLYGAAVATVHDAADSFKGSRLRPALDLAELLDRPLRVLAPAIAHRPEDIARLGALADRLRETVHGMADLEIGFCHGDLHGGNAAEEKGSFTFYDFDCCGWGYRAYDLAVFPWAFAVRHETAERVGAMGRAFLKGYARRRALGGAELEAMAAFVAIRQIWLMGLHVGLAARFGWGWLTDRYFDGQLQVLRNWEASWLDRPGSAWLQPDA
jgi:Ser/Thr protein kinase RdoA (MazF antagonist)